MKVIILYCCVVWVFENDRDAVVVPGGDSVDAVGGEFPRLRDDHQVVVDLAFDRVEDFAFVFAVLPSASGVDKSNHGHLEADDPPFPPVCFLVEVFEAEDVVGLVRVALAAPFSDRRGTKPPFLSMYAAPSLATRVSLSFEPEGRRG